MRPDEIKSDRVYEGVDGELRYVDCIDWAVAWYPARRVAERGHDGSTFREIQFSTAREECESGIEEFAAWVVRDVRDENEPVTAAALGSAQILEVDPNENEEEPW